jgi:hypothetical protein
MVMSAVPIVTMSPPKEAPVLKTEPTRPQRTGTPTPLHEQLMAHQEE